jgi:hypothetical protein
MKTGAQLIVYLLGGVVLMILLSLACSAIGIIQLPFFTLQKKVDLNRGVIDQTYNTDYCLANYEWFKQTAEGIKGMDDKISTQQSAVTNFEQSAGPRKDWTFEDKNAYNELTTRVTALKNLRTTMVNEYNARTQSLNRVACKEMPLFFNP